MAEAIGLAFFTLGAATTLSIVQEAVQRQRADHQPYHGGQEYSTASVEDDSLDLSELRTDAPDVLQRSPDRALDVALPIAVASSTQQHFVRSETPSTSAATDRLLPGTSHPGTENTISPGNSFVPQTTATHEESSPDDAELDVEQGHLDVTDGEPLRSVLPCRRAWRKAIAKHLRKITDSGMSEAQKKPITTLASTATLAALVYTVTHNGQ